MENLWHNGITNSDRLISDFLSFFGRVGWCLVVDGVCCGKKILKKGDRLISDFLQGIIP